MGIDLTNDSTVERLEAAMDAAEFETNHSHANLSTLDETEEAFTTARLALVTGALPKGGGTMTGALVLAGAPTLALHPATKTYADGIAGASVLYARNYASLAAAITAAEALGAAETDAGVTILLDAKKYDEEVTIRKNVSLRGAGRVRTRVDCVTFRPGSVNSAYPGTAGLQDLTLEGAGASSKALVVSSETADGSGIYSNLLFGSASFSGQPGLFLTNIALDNESVITGAAFVHWWNVNCPNTLTATNNYIFYVMASLFGQVDWNTDDTAAAGSIPDQLANSDPNSYFSLYTGTAALFNLTKTGSTYAPTLEMYSGHIADVQSNANTVLDIRGGTFGSRTLNGGGHTVNAMANGAYTPAVAADWDVVPTAVQTALDELAARVKALEP